MLKSTSVAIVMGMGSPLSRGAAFLKQVDRPVVDQKTRKAA
jgi:hypothetical protein